MRRARAERGHDGASHRRTYWAWRHAQRGGRIELWLRRAGDLGLGTQDTATAGVVLHDWLA